jgi:hypothetical protein
MPWRVEGRPEGGGEFPRKPKRVEGTPYDA